MPRMNCVRRARFMTSGEGVHAIGWSSRALMSGIEENFIAAAGISRKAAKNAKEWVRFAAIRALRKNLVNE